VKDPLQWCGEVAWYLCERDAACGYRSSFASQVAAIEGSTGSGSSGAERWLHLTSRYGAGSPIAKDRVMRRRWAALSTTTREILCAHYLGRAAVEEATGFRRFPRGVEAQLGLFAGVAFYMASRPEWRVLYVLPGTERQLIAAAEERKMSVLKDFRDAAKEAVAEAHRAYYDLVEAESPEVTEDDGFTSEDILAEQAETTGVYSVSRMVQRDGVWRQA
jgi:hypothetical protein